MPNWRECCRSWPGNSIPTGTSPSPTRSGPIIGPQVARVLREGLRDGQRIAGNLARDAAEFVTEEWRDVVGSAELVAFNDDVDALRDRAERLLRAWRDCAGPDA